MLAFSLFLVLLVYRTVQPAITPPAQASPSPSAQTVSTPLAPPTPSPQNSNKQDDGFWKRAGEIVDVILKVIGTLAAATWTIFTFLNERKLKPRLEPKLSGKVIVSNGTKYVLANIQVKNPGSSKVDIVQKGTVLFVYTLPPIPDSKNRVEWDKSPIASPVLENHYWIEPGETVEESVLIALQKGITEPLKLRLRINGKKVTWETVTVIENL